jgi:molybdopterin/thiamine biosynthesis adenylyltransferase
LILEKSQIQRYLRHIIMPEISGAGQKKLLDSRALIYCESVKSMESIVYYLAACGVGHINCYVNNVDGSNKLMESIIDLNSDINLEVKEFKIDKELDSAIDFRENSFVFRIFLGEGSSFLRYWEQLKNESEKNFIFTIIACINNWSGMFQTCKDREKLSLTMSTIADHYLKSPESSSLQINETEGILLTKCILGSLAVIEGIKAVLNIGALYEDLLYINLLSLEFNRVSFNEINLCFDKLMNDNKNENLVCSDNFPHNIINKTKVLIVGAGGLGSPVAYALAAAGIGKLGFIDSDVVEISNLNRQILHATSRMGLPKVDSAEAFIKKLNPDVEVVTYNTRFSEENAQKLVDEYDLVVDAVDNLASRYVLNKACQAAKKPFIEAGVLRFYGQCMTFIPGCSPCYSCVYPNEESMTNTMTCAEAGVLGVMPGLIGFLQAAEAIKVITNKGSTLDGKLLFFDALDSEFLIFNFSKNPKCIVCATTK